jgi:SAM-dependent methyltransferase
VSLGHRTGAVVAARGRILAFGRAAVPTHAECSNIASAPGVAQYVRIARAVAARVPGGRVLDWGAGWGQTSLLLAALGLRVTAYDVEDKGAGSALLAGTGVPYVIDPGPRLPFGDAIFDAVLNCGVLEHVPDERGALAELRRVLRPGGWLLTFHLPNRYAYTEWLGRRLGRFHHDRTYSRTEAIALFAGAGLEVLACRPYHVLPRNVWGRTVAGRRAGDRAAALLDRLDAGLEFLPGLSRLATAWQVLARRPGADGGDPSVIRSDAGPSGSGRSSGDTRRRADP